MTDDSWWSEPMESTIIHPEGTRMSFMNRRELLSHLDAMPEAERAMVEVVTGWRVEYGDYVHDLLARNDEYGIGDAE